jgi:polyisoprenoid-binding protein YceI
MFSWKSIQFVLVLLPAIASAPSALWPQTHPIDTGHSIITVHVFKSGLFSAFADNHEIQAPITSGVLDEAGHRVELVIDSRKLMVLDAGLAPQKRQQVQQRMLGPEVLDSDHFPDIRFEGSNIRQTAQNHFLVSGTLSLHGRTQLISVPVIRSHGRYHGSAILKQRDFGISPVTIAGGTVKVKNEVRIEFDIAEAGGERPETQPH